MGVPSRTSAPTPVLIRTCDFEIILGKVRSFTHQAEGHPQVLIIAQRVASKDSMLRNQLKETICLRFVALMINTTNL